MKLVSDSESGEVVAGLHGQTSLQIESRCLKGECGQGGTGAQGYEIAAKIDCDPPGATRMLMAKKLL